MAGGVSHITWKRLVAVKGLFARVPVDLVSQVLSNSCPRDSLTLIQSMAAQDSCLAGFGNMMRCSLQDFASEVYPQTRNFEGRLVSVCKGKGDLTS